MGTTNRLLAALVAILLFPNAALAQQNDSNLYNPDYLPGSVREQLERSRDSANAPQSQQQSYDQVVRGIHRDPPEDTAPASSGSQNKYDTALKMLGVLQQTLEQQDNQRSQDYREEPSRYEEPYRAPPRYEEPYRQPAPPPPRYEEVQRQPAPPRYEDNYRQPSRGASAPATPRYDQPAPQAPKPAGCPAGTQKNLEMAALGLASCCNSEGQCF